MGVSGMGSSKPYPISLKRGCGRKTRPDLYGIETLDSLGELPQVFFVGRLDRIYTGLKLKLLIMRFPTELNVGRLDRIYTGLKLL